MNAVTLEDGVVPGSWVPVRGTNLAATTRVWTDAGFVDKVNLPTALDGVGVNVNGRLAYSNHIGDGELNVSAPADNAVGPVRCRWK